MFSTPAFKRFSGFIQPNYIPPSAPTVKKYLKVRYLEEKNKLKDIPSSQEGIGITSDMWTSKARQGFITTTGHYITSDWQLKHCVLATRRVVESHTGEHIFKNLCEIEKEFGIENKIAGLTSDNASNMRSAGAKHSYCTETEGHTQCFAHTLQLAIEDCLQQEVIKETSVASRRLIEHFNKSTLASDALENYQTLQGEKPLKLIQDVKTRWNSTFLMFQ